MIDPITIVTQVPILTPGNNETHIGPLKDAHDIAKEALSAHGSLLDVSIFNVYFFKDAPNMAQTVVAIADRKSAAAKDIGTRVCEKIGALLWERRAEFINDFPTIDQVLDIIATHRDEGPFVVSDFGDRVAAGGSGDSTEILQATLNYEKSLAAVIPLTDARGVEAAKAAGVGASIRIIVGGSATKSAEPIEISGTVVALLDGNFIMKGPVHAGQKVVCGDTAIIAVNKTRIMLTSKPASSMDVNFFEAQGIRIKDYDFVVSKCGIHFRPSFAGFAKPIKAGTSGITAYVPGKFKVSRAPIYPEIDVDIGPITSREI